MNCKNCGFLLGPNDQFCKNCGAAVNAQESVVQPINNGVQPINNQPVNNQTPMNMQQPINMQPINSVNPSMDVQQPINNVNQPMNMQSMNTQQPSMQPNINANPNMNANNYMQPNQPNQQPKAKNNIKYIVIGIVIVIVVAIIIFVAYLLINKDSNNASNNSNYNTGSSSTATTNANTAYKVVSNNFTFSIPVDYIYESSDEDLWIGDEAGTWTIRFEIGEGSFSQLKANKSQFQSTLQQGGFTCSAAEEKTIGGVEYIVMEASESGTNFIAGFAKLNSMYYTAITVMSGSNEYDYSLLEAASPIIKSAEYTPSTNNLQSNITFDSSMFEDLAN